jgi:capsular exopolysaccharide synthesis family protein
MQKLRIEPIQKIDNKTMEEIKKLRTNISFLGPEVKVLNITSAAGKEGKSLISFWLAHTLAEMGKKVVLVDGNLRKKEAVNTYKISTGNVKSAADQVSEGLMSANTLKKYLQGRLNKEELVYETSVENLFLILSGHAAENPSELLSTAAFADLITSLRADFDYVIIDTPAIGEVTDGVIVARHCDGSILVIEPGIVPYPLALSVKNQIENSGSKVLGVVLNKF